MSRIICQLYGFRKEIEKDPYNCFKKISDIGFKEVQLDGNRGRDFHEIKDALDNAGLKVSSMHIKHNKFISDIESIIEECKLFNCNEVYLKYIEDEFQIEYGYKFTKYCLVKAAKKLSEHGIKVGLHSPEYDFNNKVDGEMIMDYICNNTDNVEIYVEPDTYWLSVAKINPIDYIKKYPGKILTLHLKDIDTTKDLMDMKINIRECGNGSVNFKEIMSWGYRNGVLKFAVEQDFSDKNIYDSFKLSYEYLLKLEKEIVLEMEKENV